MKSLLSCVVVSLLLCACGGGGGGGLSLVPPAAAATPPTPPWTLVQPIDGMHPITLVSGQDFVTTTSGVTWGVKALWYPILGANVGGNGCCLLVIAELMDGEYEIVSVIDNNFSDGSITSAGGVAGYISTVVEPAVKAWEAVRFSASGLAPTPSNSASVQFVSGLTP